MHSVSGNTEIGNGYGVPGGGAYFDAPKQNATTGKFNSNIILLMLQNSCRASITEPLSIFVVSGTVK